MYEMTSKEWQQKWFGQEWVTVVDNHGHFLSVHPQYAEHYFPTQAAFEKRRRSNKMSPFRGERR